jgi:pimeloyl-ACP methyl ester carboxylesterase
VDPSDERWLLLHGTPLTPAVWDDIAAVLRRTHAVRCPSVLPSLEAPDPQEDVARRLRADLGGVTGGLHVVGHSFGGQVALELALALPHRLRSLTVMCSRATPFPPFAAVADAVGGFGPTDLDEVLSRWFRPAELAAGGPVVEYARRCLATADRSRWGTALRGIAAYDRLAEMAGIDVPVTLIAAELDQVSPPAAMATMAERLPRGRLHVLREAAHMSPFLRPEVLAHVFTEGLAG